MTPTWITDLFNNTKKRATLKGVEFALELDDLLLIAKRSGGQCEVSQIPFDFSSSPEKGYRRPYYPSIDRKDARRGYNKDNCRLVCVAVNYAMNIWGEHVLRAIANGICGLTGATGMGIFEYGPNGRLRGTSKEPSKHRAPWRARIKYGEKLVHLGRYKSEIDAHRAYMKAKDRINKGLGPR